MTRCALCLSGTIGSISGPSGKGYNSDPRILFKSYEHYKRHIIDKNKKLLYSTEKKNRYIPPVDRALNLVLDDDRPLKIINTQANMSAAIMKLKSSEGRFLYVVKFLDPKISKYLTESKDAISSVSYTHLTLPTNREV